VAFFLIWFINRENASPAILYGTMVISSSQKGKVDNIPWISNNKVQDTPSPFLAAPDAFDEYWGEQTRSGCPLAMNSLHKSG